MHGVGLALAMKTWSSDVLLCSQASRLPAEARTRLEANGIAVRRESVDRIEHDNGALRRVVFASGAAVTREALFFSTGQYPRRRLAVDLGCAFTRKGTVKTGLLSDTNAPGVFVAGDVSHDAQFVVVAAAEGVKAALAINHALQQRELAP
jgi:thioredoxin reductase